MRIHTISRETGCINARFVMQAGEIATYWPIPPVLHPSHSQEGVRIHTISRETGKVSLWEIPVAFFTHGSGNAYDTEGSVGRFWCWGECLATRSSNSPYPWWDFGMSVTSSLTT